MFLAMSELVFEATLLLKTDCSLSITHISNCEMEKWKATTFLSFYIFKSLLSIDVSLLVLLFETQCTCQPVL